MRREVRASTAVSPDHALPFRPVRLGEQGRGADELRGNTASKRPPAYRPTTRTLPRKELWLPTGGQAGLIAN